MSCRCRIWVRQIEIEAVPLISEHSKVRHAAKTFGCRN